MWRRSVISSFSSRISLSSSSLPNPKLIPWSREFCAVNSFIQPPIPTESTSKLAIPGIKSDANRFFASDTIAATEVPSKLAASANSLNQIFEISNDAKMKRTMNRPREHGIREFQGEDCDPGDALVEIKKTFFRNRWLIKHGMFLAEELIFQKVRDLDFGIKIVGSEITREKEDLITAIVI